jgi:6-phosphogluconolactonase
MVMPSAIVHSSPEDLAAAAVHYIGSVAWEAFIQRGRFTIALAGGSTPERTYALLARPENARRVNWERTLVFFGDERLVPHDDPRSNFAMAERSLLSRVPLPADNVFAVPVEIGPPEAVAAAYAGTLAREFNLPPGGLLPRFDLILLGLGDDGHTASLFPGKPALEERDAWVVATPPGVLPPPVERVTFTFPVLNAAREVVFLVSGAGKAEVLREVLEGAPPVSERPAVGVRPAEGRLVWLVDEAAAGRLSR